MKHQNKVFRTIMALAATAILAASCAKEMMTKDEFFEGLYEKCTIEADATLPGSGDADSTANTDKAYLDGSGKVIWQIGDRLNVDGTPLTVATIDSGGICAKFYGTVNGIVDGSYRRFWAAYPATNFAASFTNPNSLSFNLPAIQTIDPSNHSLQGYTYMVGYTRVPQGFHRLHFQMRNMGSVLKLTLKANANDFRKTVDKIEFTSNANLTGTFSVDNNSNSPTISQVSGSNTLVVNFTGGGLDISSQKTIYVFLPPLLNKSLTMRIYGGYGLVPYVEKTVSSISLARNEIRTYTNTNINFDYVFSVASNRKVIFSPGNLQWSRTNGTANNTTHTVAGGGSAVGTWRFAENQWDYVGDATNGTVYGVGGNSNTKCNNAKIASDYKGWIDLFGWGTSGSARQPYYTNATNTNYGNGTNDINSTNYDWGVYNAIYNPKTGQTHPANTWRTLTRAEWNYLLLERKVNSAPAANARYTKAKLTTTSNKTVCGIILFPDNYSGGTPTGVSWGAINGSADIWNGSGSGTTCTAAGWAALEKAGCVFLPVAGYRNGTDAYGVTATKQAYYWTATHYSSGNAYHLICYKIAPAISENAERHWGCSVRLVRTHN